MRRGWSARSPPRGRRSAAAGRAAPPAAPGGRARPGGGRPGGPRRGAKAVGADAAAGHRAGAANISPFLEWCEELDISVVTLWLPSTGNLSRHEAELAAPLGPL